jgi:hypothetical protein
MGATDLVSDASTKAQGGFARFWRTLRQLFHELVGGIFAVLAFAWVQAAIRAWTQDVSHWLVAAACGVAVLLAAFSWTSFLRARQIR